MLLKWPPLMVVWSDIELYSYHRELYNVSMEHGDFTTTDALFGSWSESTGLA